MGGSVSHDPIQRLLSRERLGSAELWQVVKPYVRQIQQEDGVVALVVYIVRRVRALNPA
jgi:hypothetical protein